MAEPALAQNKKQLSEFSNRLMTIETDFNLFLGRMELAGKRAGFPFNPNKPGFGPEGMLIHLMFVSPQEARMLLRDFNSLVKRAEEVRGQIIGTGAQGLVNSERYQMIYLGIIPELKAVFDTAKEMYGKQKLDQEAKVRLELSKTKGQREQEQVGEAYALRERLNDIDAAADRLLLRLRKRENVTEMASILREEVQGIAAKARELEIKARATQSRLSAWWGLSEAGIKARFLQGQAETLELKLARIEESGRPTSIGEPEGYMRPWQPKVVRVPGTSIDRLIAPEQFHYLDLERGQVITGLGVQSLAESYARMARGERREKFFDVREFYELVPLLPKLDAILKDIKIMRESGVSGSGVLSITLNLVFAGLDMTIVSKVATTTGARITGRELASSIGKQGGRLAMTRPEMDTFMVAFGLEEKEFKDLWGLARPPSGGGLGWRRVCRELAEFAGEQEITADVIRKFLRQQTGGRAGRYAWAAKSATKDFLSSTLTFAGRERFKQRVLAEISNELRSTINQQAGKELYEALRNTAGLTVRDRRAASDAIFLTFTSFSPKAQASLLNLVRERGWSFVAREIRKDIAAAEREGLKDAAVSVGTKRGLGRLVPEYEAAFGVAPVIKHLAGSSAMYFAIAPAVWGTAMKALGMAFKGKEYVGKPPSNEAEAMNAFDREMMALEERARKAAEERSKKRAK